MASFSVCIHGKYLRDVESSEFSKVKHVPGGKVAGSPSPNGKCQTFAVQHYMRAAMRSWRGRREPVAPQPYRKKLITGKSRYFVKPRVSSQRMIASGYPSTVCSGNDGSSSYPVVDFSNL